MKKITRSGRISLALALVMTLSAFTATAVAADETEGEKIIDVETELMEILTEDEENKEEKNEEPELPELPEEELPEEDEVLDILIAPAPVIDLPELPFTDVAVDAYYYDAVKWAYENGITSGLTATEFAPSGTCTRAQTVTFLWRAEGCPEVEGIENPFVDVAADAYYYKAVLWAVSEGITTGVDATHFAPDSSVTREQTVTFMFRAAGSFKAAAEAAFEDVTADRYSYDAICWAVENGITNGMSETLFSPAGDCLRMHIVTFIYRFVNIVPEEPIIIPPIPNPITEYDSLEAINEIVGGKLTTPGVMGVTEEYFLVIDTNEGLIEEYKFTLNGNMVSLRFSPMVDRDICGIWVTGGTAFEGLPVDDTVDLLDAGEYKTARWFTADGQYTAVFGDAEGTIDMDTFAAIAAELSGKEVLVLPTPAEEIPEDTVSESDAQ